MDGRPNPRNKAACSNFSGVVCTGLQTDFNTFVFCFSPQTPHLGGPGLPNCGLSEDECQLVQRFDPTRLYKVQTDQTDTYNLDTIGFFIAKFVKKCL